MKLNRIILTSAAIVILVALGVWRFSGTQREIVERFMPARPIGQPAGQGASPENAAAVPPQNLGPVAAPDLPKSQLLRSIVTAIEGIHSTPDALKKDARLQAAANEVAPADLPSVIDFLWHKQHLSGAGEELRNRLVQRWAGTDPKAASTWVAQQPASSIQSDALDRIAVGWANLNFNDAVAWARQLPESNAQHESLARIAYETARTAPLEAMKLAVELPVGATRDDTLAHVAGTWAASEPRAAAAWAKQIEDAVLRERLLVSVATVWGEASPAEAAGLALEFLSRGRGQDDAVVGIVQGWVQNEPEAAAAWVLEFPEGTLRETALENLVSIWADQNVEQAGKWLKALVAGPTRDVAVGALVGKVMLHSPKSASEWAAEISDDARRQQELENVGEAWLESDATTARAWITQSSLSTAAKARLLAPAVISQSLESVP